MSYKQYYYYSFKAMGSPCELQFACDDKQQADKVYQQVVSRVEQLEQRYSRFRNDSLVSKINQSAGSGNALKIDQETEALLDYAEQCYQESDGLFDITSGVLRKVWNFSNKSFDYSLVAIEEQIEQILPLVNWQDVKRENGYIELAQQGMQIDFGGIVKEYAADCVKDICLNLDIHSGMINMGGDISVMGALLDGKGWPISLQNPNKQQAAMANIALTSGAMASSGDYERFIEIDGDHYSHIINPKTGWPVKGLRAVSVLAPHCIIAGSIATIAMLKGHSGAAWLESCGAKYLYFDAGNRLVNQLLYP